MGDTFKKQPLLVAWSSGKDSALALDEVKRADTFDITLLVTITEGYGRVSMHGVREELLDVQVASLGIPVEKVYIPVDCTNEEYGRRMQEVLTRYASEGVSSVAFGDIHLQSVREYREKNLQRIGMEAMFPLWGRDPGELSVEFLRRGYRAITTCVDSAAVDKCFVGRLYDRSFLDELPAQADPCGENGEFHTFVFDGPLFSRSVGYEKGEVILRDDRFYFCDLLSNEPRE